MTLPTSTTSMKAIDIQEAFSILSARAKTGENLSNAESVPNELKGRGQTIDINQQLEFTKSANFKKCECASDSENRLSGDSAEDSRHEAMKQERNRRAAEIKSKVRSLSIPDLLGMIFRAQQERVGTYKIYEE
jgi:hypothetical protein